MRGSAYSVVRYTDPLNGQRLNLGVILFHPLDGLACRFSDKLTRLQSIDPRISLEDIKTQLDAIKESASQGSRRTLDELVERFNVALEVSKPFPARISGSKAAIDHLFEMLVVPHQDVRRANYQKTFNEMLRRGLSRLVGKYPNATFSEGPKHPLNGIKIDLGFITEFGTAKALWRSLSLQPKEQKSTRLERSKSTAMELKLIDEVPQFRSHQRIVALQVPSGGDVSGIEEAEHWIEHAGAAVVRIGDESDLDGVLNEEAKWLMGGSRPTRGERVT